MDRRLPLLSSRAPQCNGQEGLLEVDLSYLKRIASLSVQLLRELMQICPDLACPLGHIRDAVGQALYSNYYAASDGSLELKQLPYFAVVQRLELEKSNLQQKYDNCQKVCAAHGVRSLLDA